MNVGDIKKYLKDGTLSFSDGADAGLPANEIGMKQVAFSKNVTFRNGKIRPRPGLKQRKLTFTHNTKAAFQNGFFQTASGYNGATFDALMCSHGGRQFKIDIDTNPGTITVTTADFTIPAVNVTVVVTVDDTSNLESQSTSIQIGGYVFYVVAITSTSQITVRNDDAANVGIPVASGADVTIRDTFEVQEITPKVPKVTTTTADFVIPAVGNTVVVAVLDSTGMILQLPFITIGGYTLQVTAVTSPISITVKNESLGSVGIPIASGADVSFGVLDTNNPNIQLNWSIQAENYWILQDNDSYPVIFDGSATARSNPKLSQIPVGNVMAYTMGRITVALPDRRTFRVGDLLFDPNSGTAGLNYKDSILFFTSNNFTNEGGDFVARVFGAPSNSGEILAMKAGSMLDTQLGQGPLTVGTPNVNFTINLPFDRTTWKDLNTPLQTANPVIGPTANDSTVLVNADTWYRSLDGIRSYITAQRQHNSGPGNTPQSGEIDPLLAADTEMWLEFGSAVLFDNRLLMTISPQLTTHGCYHRGLAVLDFNLSSGLKRAGDPSWECIWTGVRILKIIQIIVRKQERCFLFALNDQSEIELWELSKHDKDDDGQPITCEIQFRSMVCGDSDQFKKLKTARIIVSDLSGDVAWRTSYRTDESSCWTDWDSGTLCSKNEDCGPYDCSGPVTYQSQARYPLRMKEPADDFDDITGRKKSTGFEIQPMLVFTGYMTVKELRIYCLPESEMLGIEVQNQT